MSDKFFLDTNVFVYSVTEDDPAKAQVATELIRKALETQKGVVSYQVVQEFFNLATRKFEKRLPVDVRDSYLNLVFRPMLRVHSSLALYTAALAMQGKHQLQWYDALIVCAAEQAGCGILYSEDLQHGQRFGSLQIVNPFLY
jgi:predicted nucleic acid-binding protein